MNGVQVVHPGIRAILSAVSKPLPPIYLAHTSAPVESNFATKPSPLAPVLLLLIEVGLGRSVDWVNPVTYVAPAPSTAIAFPRSKPLPPKKVEYVKAVPVELTSVTNASRLPALAGPMVVGKPVAVVLPVTKALPLPSIAIPLLWANSPPT